MSIIRRITLEEEMEKCPELKLSDIQSLKEWCEEQPHLPKIEDSFLALFLHSNYYQMEQTKNTIENYYTIRTHVPEFFSNRDPLENQELRQAFKMTGCFPLNGVTKDGYKMIYGTILDADPSHFNYNDNNKYSFMLWDIFFLTNGITKGYVNIVDFGKLSFGHVTRMNMSSAKKNLHYVQEAAPMRLKEIHVINAPPAMEFLMNLFKPIMKKELINLMHFHSSLESLSKHIPIDSLPNDIGGNGGFIQELVDIQVKQIEDYREWFLLDEATGRVNEALRINISKKQSCCIT